MIAFVTSLRARALAQNWAYHVWLLEQTIRSMLAQSESDVRVVVACHEIPDTRFKEDARVRFLSVDFDPPSRNNDDMCVDKVLKLSVASQSAIQSGCDYIVFNDADDLVSNRLAAYVTQHPASNGWYCGQELFYIYGGRFVRHYVIPGRSAGPCVIVRSELLTFDAPPFSGKWTEFVRSAGEDNYLRLLARHGMTTNTLAAVGLGNYRDYMAARSTALAPLPFPANVVINHDDSTATVAGGTGSYDRQVPSRRPRWRTYLSAQKARVKRLPTMRFVGRSMREEFSIPDGATIPVEYSGRGSIFWR